MEDQPWTVPCDRILKLLSKLNIGWSSISAKPQNHHTTKHEEKQQKKITELHHFHLEQKGLDKPGSRVPMARSEYQHVLSVLERNDALHKQEQLRIQNLQLKCGRIKARRWGDGLKCCISCGEKASFLVTCCGNFYDCTRCGKLVCRKCAVNCSNPGERLRVMVCVICYQDDIFWKQSGAWFDRSLAKPVEEKTMEEEDAISGYDSDDSLSLEVTDELMLTQHSINLVFRKILMEKCDPVIPDNM